MKYYAHITHSFCGSTPPKLALIITSTSIKEAIIEPPTINSAKATFWIVAQVETMLDYTRYTEVFPAGTQLPYDKKLQQQIEAHRKAFDGTLFIDRVLTALGITKGEL